MVVIFYRLGRMGVVKKELIYVHLFVQIIYIERGIQINNIIFEDFSTTTMYR